jgi:hypothetical protein
MVNVSSNVVVGFPELCDVLSIGHCHCGLPIVLPLHESLHPLSQIAH